MRALVTGFGPFLSNEDNPSDRLARALGGRRARGVSLRACSPLPVEYGRAAALALRAAALADAHAIVAFGLAGGAARIRLERRGANRCAAVEADGAGAIRAGRPVVPGAPRSLRATLDPEPLRAALAASGIGVDLSDDAGGYVCNDLLYRLLHAGRRALFVHVPSDVDVHRVAGPLAQGIARAVRGSVVLGANPRRGLLASGCDVLR